MKKIKLLRIIGVCVFLSVLAIIFFFNRPEKIIERRIERQFQNKTMSLANVKISNSLKITFELQTSKGRLINKDDGKVLSEFIDCIKLETAQYEEVLISLNNNIRLLSVKMKRDNDGLYISEFICETAEIYLDVLSCFDFSRVEKIIYRGEAIESYESTFSQMTGLKYLSLNCKQNRLADDMEYLPKSLTNLENLDFYVINMNKEETKRVQDLSEKYPNVIIRIKQTY